MGMLIKLALLLSILGVAQVYSGEFKNEEGDKRSCYKEFEQLQSLGGYHLQNLKELLQEFQRVDYHKIIEYIEKCGCEKESFGDKKCEEELYFLIQSAKENSEKYRSKIINVFQALAYVCQQSGLAYHEYHCCCSKADHCSKKYEYRSKEQVKECKSNKCNKALNELLSYLYKCKDRQRDLAEVIKYIEELLKNKEEYKEGKCPSSYDTLRALHYESCNLSYVVINLYLKEEKELQRYFEEALKEIKECKV